VAGGTGGDISASQGTVDSFEYRVGLGFLVVMAIETGGFILRGQRGGRQQCEKAQKQRTDYLEAIASHVINCP
jgi:hypothetical protein